MTRDRPGRQVERGQQRDRGDEAHGDAQRDCRPPARQAVVGEGAGDADPDGQVQERPRREPRRVAAEHDGARHRGAARQARQHAELALGDPEGVHHVVFERHAERRAEVPEEDEDRGPPERPGPEARPQRGQRLLHRGAVEARSGVTHRPGGGGERQHREQRDQEEDAVVRDVGREVAASDARQDARPVDGRPLDRLEPSGEAAGLALLHHDRIAEHVGEREAETRQSEDHERDSPGIRREEPQREPPERRHRRRHEQVGPAPGAEEGNQVRDEPVERLHVPGKADQREERGGIGRAEPHLVLEQEEDGRGREAGVRLRHALHGVDRGEEDEEAPERRRRAARQRTAPG